MGRYKRLVILPNGEVGILDDIPIDYMYRISWTKYTDSMSRYPKSISEKYSFVLLKEIEKYIKNIEDLTELDLLLHDIDIKNLKF